MDTKDYIRKVLEIESDGEGDEEVCRLFLRPGVTDRLTGKDIAEVCLAGGLDSPGAAELWAMTAVALELIVRQALEMAARGKLHMPSFPELDRLRDRLGRKCRNCVWWQPEEGLASPTHGTCTAAGPGMPESRSRALSESGQASLRTDQDFYCCQFDWQEGQDPLDSPEFTPGTDP